MQYNRSVFKGNMITQGIRSLCGHGLLALVVLPMLACLEESLEVDSLSEVSSSIVFNGHDYLFVTTAKGWDEARSRCQSRGYDLVSIDSVNEQNFILAQPVVQNTFDWWIGYTDVGIEGTWRWSNNSMPTFVNWNFDPPNIVEPNNSWGIENCAVMYGSSGKWNDSVCSNQRGFICEKSPPPAGNNGTCPSFSINNQNTNNATVNTVDCPINLFQGMLLTVGTCGLPGAMASFDTFIRLNNPMGMQMTFNDDACSTNGSNLSVVIPASGTYILKQGCFGSSSCGGTSAYSYF